MALNPADIATVSHLLDEALALEPADRETWLAALSAEHQRHAEALRDMLAQEAKLNTDPRLNAMPKLAADDAVAHAGDRIGPYRLLHEIGRGGMGSVWLAERADGAYKRQVALKLPRLAWGAGLAERMAREREIGMLLEHPNIARLYDAGVDERGRPFLALEYVDGQPIDAWCEAQGLSVRDRLRLFQQVIKAVAYAHGRLVVHRDLKPSNVLVTPDGQAHLLDFGIAKLLLEVAPGEAGLTQEQGRVLTPHYASPEQVTGEAITVQSDVYGLGVLLYEVLTGTLAIAPKRNTAAAVEDAVLRGEAPPASSRAKLRAVAKALRGEIDAILGKAMKREAGDRYATADALADDIDRHLRGDVVLAQPDRLGYRLRKALQRHRLPFAAGASIGIAVMAGAGVSVLQAQRANAEADRARVVKEFVVDVFKVNERGNGGNQTLRQLPAEMLLERGASLIAVKFPGQPSLQAELYGVVSGIFADMGGAKLAEEYSTKHLTALEATAASDVEKSRAIWVLASSLADQDRLSEAALQAERALRLSAGNFVQTVRSRLLLVRINTNLARYGDASVELDRVQDELKSLPKPWAPELAIIAAESLWYRAQLTTRSGLDQGSTSVLWDQAIAAALQVEGPTSRLAAAIRIDFSYRLAWVDGARAREELARALVALRAVGGPDDMGAALAQSRGYAMLFEVSRVSFAEAVSAITESQSILANQGSKVPPSVRASVDFNLGWVYRNWGDLEKAYALQSGAATAMREVTESPFALRVIDTSVGIDAMQTGRHAEADMLLNRALELRKIDSLGSPSNVAMGYMFVAYNLLMQDRVDEAERQFDASPASPDVLAVRALIALTRSDPNRALALLRSSAYTFDRNSDDSDVEGAALCDAGDSTGGLTLIDAYVARRAADRYIYDPSTARARAVAGLCAIAAGQRIRAVEYAVTARQAFTAQPGVSPYYKAPLFKLERALGLKLPAI